METRPRVVAVGVYSIFTLGMLVAVVEVMFEGGGVDVPLKAPSHFRSPNEMSPYGFTDKHTHYIRQQLKCKNRDVHEATPPTTTGGHVSTKTRHICSLKDASRSYQCARVTPNECDPFVSLLARYCSFFMLVSSL